MKNFPLDQLKAALESADGEALAVFLHSYTLGAAADMFISVMIQPNQRTEFLVAIAKAYPSDWQAAVKELAEETK